MRTAVTAGAVVLLAATGVGINQSAASTPTTPPPPTPSAPAPPESATVDTGPVAVDVEENDENGVNAQVRLFRDLYVLSEDGELTRRDGRAPARVAHRVTVTRLAEGEELVGLDTRPATGQLYALGSSGQLYRLNPDTGAASMVGSPVPILGRAVGFDFNPTVDRIRVITSLGRNLRLHPDTGALAGTDTQLRYAAGDRSAGRTPRAAAAGYTNSVPGATSTALYDIDSAQDTLVTQGSTPGATPAVSPNTGQLFTVGPLGFDVRVMNGFDIAGAAEAGPFDPADYRAVAAVQTSGQDSILLSVDLRTGQARIAAPLGTPVIGLTFAP